MIKVDVERHFDSKPEDVLKTHVDLKKLNMKVDQVTVTAILC